MSRSGSFRSLRWLTIVFIVVATATSTVTYGQESDPIASAQELVRVFFPELANRRNQMLVYWSDPFDNSWTTAGFLREFGLQLAETREEFLKAENDDTVGSGLLSAYCEFEATGQLHAMYLKGRANHYREHASLRSLVDHHREWSDGQVTDTLNGQGALFGPEHRDAFVKALPRLSGLTLALGNSPRVASIDFVMRSTDPVDTTYAELEWQVELEVQVGMPRTTARYVAAFEPFGGKLLSIHVKSRVP